MTSFVWRLTPAFKDNLWGGRRLIDEFHMDCPLERAAEAWVLSCYPGSESRVADGPLAGLTLSEAIQKAGAACLGTRAAAFDFFPLLVKFIDAKQDLSIQVHPDDAYAREHEGGYGKTEMWVVMDADPGARLYYGFERELSRREFADRIADNTLPEVLHAVAVRPGDVFFIPAGTIHAIGAGLLIAEIQQNSNTTYRVYDYGRRDAAGHTRELHVPQALDVTRRGPAPQTAVGPVLPAAGGSVQRLATCPAFTTDRLRLQGRMNRAVDGGSFESLLCLQGQGTLTAGDGVHPFRRGDCLFVSAGAGEIVLDGDALLLAARV